MRDLFQVVFELKKKEIELAKQHIEHSVIKCGNYALERTHDTKVNEAVTRFYVNRERIH